MQLPSIIFDSKNIMAKMIKRIPLDSLTLTDLAVSNPSDPENPGENPDIPTLPSLKPSFSFDYDTLPGYGSPLAVTNIDFAFPADDLKRVQAWFSGDFSHVTEPESATLKKNMRSAVLEALDSFISSAVRNNLFTAPFTIGCRYRLFDGSISEAFQPVTIIPVSQSPDIIITGYKIYEKALHTEVSFSRYPGRLLFSVPVPENSSNFKDIITSVEFLITKPVTLYPSDANVSGIRSITINGTRMRSWHYDSYDEQSLLASAMADNDARVVASIPFEDIVSGKYAPFGSSPDTGSEPGEEGMLYPLPMEAGVLQRFSSLPKKAGSTLPGGWRPFLHIATPPLDLGYPENEKSVMELYLRGVFSRPDVVMTLYGSRHREDWKMIARSQGPYIRGLRRAPFRWFKVELSLPMRRDDFLDALTFRFAT